MLGVGLKRKSSWNYVTSSGAGPSLGIGALEFGNILLKDPRGSMVSLKYGGTGVGKSICLRKTAANAGVPKGQQVNIPLVGKGGLTVAPSSMESGAVLYVTEQCHGPELARNDLTGICMFAEVGGGFVAVATATAMFIGLSHWIMPQFLVQIVYVTRALVGQLSGSAKAILLMYGKMSRSRRTSRHRLCRLCPVSTDCREGRQTRRTLE